MKSNFFFTSILLLFLPIVTYGQITIKGQIELDSTWRKKIFVSEIKSLHDMFKCSNDLIIGSSVIDSTGNWRIIIPEQNQPKLFRLHVSKKEYPKASLIIGGKDENYGFIAAFKSDTLKYISKDNINDKLILDFSFDSDPLNKKMLDIKTLSDQWNTLDGLTNDQEKKKLLRKTHIANLISIADTTQTILPAIYATYISDFGFNKDQVYESMNNIKSRIGTHDYLNDYTVEAKPEPFTRALLLMILCLCLLWLMYKLNGIRKKGLKNKRLKSLTVREIEIFNLIKLGRSNKEISNSLNIEISTVKRHVNSIFSKLKIKSRNKIKTYYEN